MKTQDQTCLVSMKPITQPKSEHRYRQTKSHLVERFDGRRAGIFTSRWQSFSCTKTTAQTEILGTNERAAAIQWIKSTIRFLDSNQMTTKDVKECVFTLISRHLNPKSRLYLRLKEDWACPRIGDTAPIDENRRRLNVGKILTLLLPQLLDASSTALNEVKIPESLIPETMELVVATAITITRLLNQHSREKLERGRDFYDGSFLPL